jgi:hypothetical protein
MRARTWMGIASAAALAGCGIEGFVGGVTHTPYPRPASVIRGSATWVGAQPSQFSVTDGSGKTVTPFEASVSNGTYELRLPSSSYTFLVVQAKAGNMALRAIVPSLVEESTVEGVNLDAVSMTETLIVETRLKADNQSLAMLTPATYEATANLILQAMGVPGPTQDLYNMVARIIPRQEPYSGVADPDFFRIPGATWVTLPTPTTPGVIAVTSSPLDNGWLARNPFDYTGSGCPPSSVCSDSAAFDAQLAAVAPLYKPAGCADPDHIRLVFSVDFSPGALNGNGGAVNRFKWATDAPGKSMFFVGWIYTGGARGIAPSDIQDPVVNEALGASNPNVIRMYDDGTHGDEAAGDNIWTVYFDVPRGAPPTTVLRIGYKYTWGTQGAPWTGSEEWPGNSRILEVVDVNGDDFVNRRDVFGDEATNKDNANLSLSIYNPGYIDWTTAFSDIRPSCGPESHEQKVTPHIAQTCDDWITPTKLGALTVPCQ